MRRGPACESYVDQYIKRERERVLTPVHDTDVNEAGEREGEQETETQIERERESERERERERHRLRETQRERPVFPSC